MVLEHLEPLAKVCVWGMEEDTKDCKEFIDEGFTLSLDVFVNLCVLQDHHNSWPGPLPELGTPLGPGRKQ